MTLTRKFGLGIGVLGIPDILVACCQEERLPDFYQSSSQDKPYVNKSLQATRSKTENGCCRHHQSACFKVTEKSYNVATPTASEGSSELAV
jgi:hypothetical protein